METELRQNSTLIIKLIFVFLFFFNFLSFFFSAWTHIPGYAGAPYKWSFLDIFEFQNENGLDYRTTADQKQLVLVPTIASDDRSSVLQESNLIRVSQARLESSHTFLARSVGV